MQQENHITHLHAFRGFAILNIVGAHAWSFMIFWTGDLDSDGLTWLFGVTETLFHGATLYFTIISGLLFVRVLKNKGWKRFYYNKALNVVLPYFVMTIAFTLAYWQYYVQTAEQSGSEANFLISVLHNLPSGQASIHFWYIPVLLFLFVITPLLDWIQRRMPALMWGLALLPLLIARSPFPEFLKPQTFIFFTGAYALGMLLGQHYERISQWSRDFLPVLFFVSLATSVTILLQYLSSYETAGWFSARQTLIYAQKVSLCLLVLHVFRQREALLPRWLHILGTYAFAIYFLHVLFIGLAISQMRTWLPANRPVEIVSLMGAGNFVFGILASVLIAVVLQKMLGRHTKKLIGV